MRQRLPLLAFEGGLADLRAEGSRLWFVLALVPFVGFATGLLLQRIWPEYSPFASTCDED